MRIGGSSGGSGGAGGVPTVLRCSSDVGQGDEGGGGARAAPVLSWEKDRLGLEKRGEDCFVFLNENYERIGVVFIG